MVEAVAAPIATVVDEVTATRTVVEGVALAAAGVLPAPHLPGVAVTITADPLGVAIRMCQAIDGLRDDEDPLAGPRRQT